MLAVKIIDKTDILETILTRLPIRVAKGKITVTNYGA